MAKIASDSQMNDGLEAMMGRVSEFNTPMAAKLTGIALNPIARRLFDDTLDAMWATTKVPSHAQEIIIGGGLSAAIYSAVRVSEGHPKPLVLEAKERAGGAFASSREATFFLNSRNRPGKLGTPGRGEALNYLPGAVVQPSDLGSEEYQTNAALAFAIRATLAMTARVVTGQRVESADSSGVVLAGGKKVKATRVIWATGLGQPISPPETDGRYLMDYLQFLSHLDQPFPFKGIDRVAVVGAQDAGRTVIEALTGQGPSRNWSISSLDYISTIDWYGVAETCTTKERWEQNNRSRYKGIGRLLPRVTNEEGKPIGDSEFRVTPITRRAENVGVGFDGAYVDGARYDLVIFAAGFTGMDVADMIEYRAGGRVVARMGESGLFVIGPAAKIADEVREANVPTTVPENSAALFRYADRTAALAKHLPALELSSTAVEPKPKARARAAAPKKKARDTSDYRNWTRGDTIELDGKEAEVLSVEGRDVRVRERNKEPRYLSQPSAWEFVR
jgi:hypothetical protein